MKWLYVILPALVVVTMVAGSMVTGSNIPGWYNGLKFPSWTPPGAVIGMIWTVIFSLFIVSAILLVKNVAVGQRFYVVLGLMVLNLVLNYLWSALFFGAHQIGWALAELVILELSVWAIIVALYPLSTVGALLFLPYAFWVAFAGVLNFMIWKLN